MLEAVIAHEQVDLLFQPIFDAETGTVAAAEALVRCAAARDAESLFSRASSAALDERLSRLVQRKALGCAAVWEGALKDIRISINLLPADICRAGYDRWLLDEIDLVGINPKRITLEITEGALVTDHEAVALRLMTLREAGLKIAVDDFGTGYASLAYLTSLPLDMLKIDKGLVAEIVRREPDRIVVKALISLARELGLQVVVEGVESAEQLALLKDWGCGLYQGFFGAPPLTHQELSDFAMRQPALSSLQQQQPGKVHAIAAMHR
ncbi:MAG TPA: EAL domain-containing protein [Sphingomicrobium sp.]|jgi:EAL domain-containing protein (putative c-di-GMP-specific phosphodiesterase class I)|nr:EAL domain-containing protein [Sphingomicrobium sp.]